MPKVHLITTCTNSKYHNAQRADLEMFQNSPSLEHLAKLWCANLESIPDSEKLPAIERYKGLHWSVAKSCLDEQDVELWIISAGLGLVHLSTLIPDYQATFAGGGKNSIPSFGLNRHIANQHWWNEISARQHCSLSLLFDEHPEDIFIVSGSKDYIKAVQTDLCKGVQFLNVPESQLLIITSGSETYSQLDEFIVRSQSNMARSLKANMLTLNIALAKQLLIWLRESPEMSLKDISKKVSSLIGEKLVSGPKGVRCTEQEVCEYLKRAIRLNPNLRVTPALREFRANGNSFEANRFKAIFQKVKEVDG